MPLFPAHCYSLLGPYLSYLASGWGMGGRLVVVAGWKEVLLTGWKDPTEMREGALLFYYSLRAIE